MGLYLVPKYPQKRDCIGSPVYFYMVSAGFPGVQVLAHHQGNPEDDGMVELAQIQAGELTDLFQTVDQSISVDEQLTGISETFRLFSKNLLMVNRVSWSRESREFFLKTSRRKISHRVVGS